MWRNACHGTHARCFRSLGDGEGPRGGCQGAVWGVAWCGVMNGPVFFPLQEHSKFEEANQKPRMINRAVYNESYCVCLWTPLPRRSGAPGAEKHLALESLPDFLLAQSRKGEEGFSLQGNSKGNQSWWAKWYGGIRTNASAKLLS